MNKLIAFCLFICNIGFSQNYKLRDSLLRVASEKTDTMRIKALNVLGSFFVNVDPDSSIFYSRLALKEAERIDYGKGIAHAYSNIGLTLNNRGDYSEALKNYFLCIKFREKINDKKGMQIVYSRIGTVFLNSKKFDLAIQYERKALTLCKELNYEKEMAFSYNNIGNIYAEMQDQDSALVYYKKALEIKRRIGVGPASMGTTLLNISVVYLLKGNYPEALTYCLESTKLFEDNGLTNFLAPNYTDLGTICIHRKEYNKAIYYLNKSVEISIKLGAKANLKDAYSQLAIAHEKSRDFKTALEYERKSADLKDSILNEDNNRQLAEMQTRYQSDQKEKENLLLQAKDQLSTETIRKQRTISYFIIACLILAVLFGFFIFRGYRQKQKANIIITQQKEDVEAQKIVVESQKHLIELHQKEMIDSINYAKRIQYALLANDAILKNNIGQHFVLFKPKDIVSGDFYWAAETNTKFYLAICDSTGHGVPGAFMSLLNMGFLSEAIKEKKIEQPNEVLNYVRSRLIESIGNDGQQDGMDAVLVCIDKKDNTLSYAAANNAPVLLRNGILEELPKDKMPVGKGEKTESFTLHTIDHKKGDIIYLYTDGFADQFGGPKGKKYKYKKLNDFLVSICKEDMHKQKQLLENDFHEWKGGLEQVDDVCVLGIKI